MTRASAAQRTTEDWLTPFRIVFAYVLVGVLWYAFSHRAFLWLLRDVSAAERWETVAELSYIMVMAWGIYFLVRRYVATVRHSGDALRQSEEEYRFLFDAAPISIGISDLEGKVLAANRAMQEMTGYTLEEFRDVRTGDTYVDPAERRQLLGVLATAGRLRNQEARLKRRNGTVYTALLNIDRVELGGKEVLFTTARDITERKQTADRILHQNRRLSVLYAIDRACAQSLALEELLNDALDATLRVLEVEAGGFFLLEPDGETMVLCVPRGLSEEFVRATGRIKLGEGISGQAAAQGKPVILNVADYPTERLAPTIVREGFQTLASTPLLAGGELLGALNLGTRRVRAFPEEEVELLAAIGQQLGAAVRNVRLYERAEIELAERKQAEAELARHRDHLEELVEERTRELRSTQDELVKHEKLALLGRMAGSVAHELRNPLSVVRNAAYYLKLTLGRKLDDKQTRHLEMIDEYTERSARVISAILDLTRSQPAERHPVPLGAILDKVTVDVGLPSNIEVDLEIPEGLPDIFVDQHQMAIVFRNLLVNAGQAMPTGGRIRVRAASDAAMVKVSVADTGVGIKSDDMHHLFEPLFSTKTVGLGLGLAVSKGLVEGNGGTIEAESQEGQGTAFTVCLPVAVRNIEAGNEGSPD